MKSFALGNQDMAVKSAVWGWIRYTVFLSLFVSLIAVYWTFSYEVVLNLEGVQVAAYPYRGYTILLIVISALLFGVYVYSGFRQHNKK